MIPFKIDPKLLIKAAAIAALVLSFLFMYYRIDSLSTKLETANRTVSEQSENITKLQNGQKELVASVESVRKRFSQLEVAQKKNDENYQKASDILQDLKAQEANAISDPNILKRIQQESDDYERQAQCAVGYLSSCS